MEGTATDRFAAVPDVLKGFPNWVLYKLEPRGDGTFAKVPYSPRTGYKASPTNPDTWGFYNRASEILNADANQDYAGLGFVFTDGLGIVGIDLDHCVDPEGVPEPWAAEILEQINSYSEFSQSGRGAHILVYGKMPPIPGNRKGKVEIYSNGRYFAMTGNHIPGTVETIEHRQEQLNELHRRVFSGPPQGGVEHPATKTVEVSNLSDAEIIEKAKRSANGERFERLLRGDITGFPSQSEADQSFCNDLAYWTGNNAEQMDRIFRASGLYREKWDQKHGQKTYGEATIEKAIADTQRVYDPNYGKTAQSAPPVASTAIVGKVPEPPRALALRDFMAVERPPLTFHIEGLLPTQGKMTISAPAKGHKTFLMMGLGYCLASGNVEWLNMKFGEPCKVLMIQPELSDPLIAARVGWMLKTMPIALDRENVLDNFILMETAQGRPNLTTPEGRARVESLIQKHRPQVLVCDPLYMLFCGLSENDADEMSKALDYLADLTVRYGCAIILSHHFNKSGTAARGSSVFQGWGETDLSMVPVDKDPSVFKVEALLRCSFAKGFPAYWRRPSEHDAWFHAMSEGWKPEAGTRTKKAEAKHAVAAMKLTGERLAAAKTLIEGIQELTGCGQRTAFDVLREAKDLGLLEVLNGLYSLPIQPLQ